MTYPRFLPIVHFSEMSYSMTRNAFAVLVEQYPKEKQLLPYSKVDGISGVYQAIRPYLWFGQY